MIDRLRGLLERIFSSEQLNEKLEKLEMDLLLPVKIIGIGQTGVGKTELLKSIFRITQEDIDDYLKFKAEREEDIQLLKTGHVKSVTKDFFSFVIKHPQEQFRVQFTDGPGLGESAGELEEKYLQMWIEEIPKHDLLYWVLDASSRDIAHIQLNMKKILDATNYRNKLVVVLNKVDQILLPTNLEEAGVIGWDVMLNRPSTALKSVIEERTDDIIDKLTQYVNISKEHIVVCSARKRWNHGTVLDKFLDTLPTHSKIKASRNRQEKDPTELIPEYVRKQLNDKNFRPSSLYSQLPKRPEPEDLQEKFSIIKKSLETPIRLIGIGQTGVGKTELLRAMFRISEENVLEYAQFKSQKIDDLEYLVTGAVKSVTKNFFSFIIQNPFGFQVQFTDGPGLGESAGELEEKYLQMWIEEIPKHDLLYWVLDASSRDIAHIQLNMKKILDATNYRNKLVVVLNKVDQILLPIELEIQGIIGWDINSNAPSHTLLRTIEQRMDDVIDKLTKHVQIDREQIVICSARKRWNHDKVIERFLSFLPQEIKTY